MTTACALIAGGALAVELAVLVALRHRASLRAIHGRDDAVQLVLGVRELLGAALTRLLPLDETAEGHSLLVHELGEAAAEELIRMAGAEFPSSGGRQMVARGAFALRRDARLRSALRPVLVAIGRLPAVLEDAGDRMHPRGAAPVRQLMPAAGGRRARPASRGRSGLGRGDLDLGRVAARVDQQKHTDRVLQVGGRALVLA